MSYTLYYHKYSPDFFQPEKELKPDFFKSFLCERDYNKFLSLKDEVYKTEFLLIRLLLADILKVHKSSIKVSDLSYTEKGKPYFENHHGFRFSFAHTNGVVSIIFANDEVGLDVECCQQNVRELSSFLTPLEVNEIAKSNEHFWDIWTKKESAVKLEGSTLARFRRYCTIENPSGYFYSTVDVENWKFCVSSKKRIQKIEIVEVKKIPLL